MAANGGKFIANGTGGDAAGITTGGGGYNLTNGTSMDGDWNAAEGHTHTAGNPASYGVHVWKRTA